MSNIRWKTMNINFIVKLLEFIIFDIVMTVIDSVSKKTHFILIYITITTKSAIRSFLYNI